MLVTSLEPISKTRTRVTLDYDRTLVLSNKEITSYGLAEDCVMDDAVYAEIVTMQKSAALVRAGNLLKGMDYTVKGMRDKLIRTGYPEEVVENTVERLSEAGYLNDRRFAEGYLHLHMNDRSLARIRMDLTHKGISRDLLTDILQSYEEEHAGDPAEQERNQILRFLARKHYDPYTMTYEETARIKMSLLRKGYSMDRIREAMEAIN